MNGRHLSITFLSVFLLFPLHGFAASSSSSSSASSEPAVVTEDRAFRVRMLSGSTLKTDGSEKYQATRASYFSARAANRAQCREEIRRANKTTLVKTMLRCYRTELTLWKDYLAAQTTELQQSPGIIPTTRTQALKKVHDLSDALTTIIFAIDSGVYGTKEDLLEAKTNLYKKYEVPLAATWVTVRADRGLSWIALLVRGIDQLKEKGTDDARACLVFQESTLRHLINSVETDRSTQLSTTLTGIQNCVKKIQAIPVPKTGTGATVGS